MDLAARRQAQNEAVFRRLNERIADLRDNVVWMEDDASVEFVCECSEIGCSERFELSRSEYERARSHPRWFVVKTSHDDPTIERVVEQGNGFAIVEKLGEAGEVAEAESAVSDRSE